MHTSIHPQPHDSLHNIEAVYEIELEKPGEVAELEGIVQKAMESGMYVCMYVCIHGTLSNSIVCTHPPVYSPACLHLF